MHTGWKTECMIGISPTFTVSHCGVFQSILTGAEEVAESMGGEVHSHILPFTTLVTTLVTTTRIVAVVVEEVIVVVYQMLKTEDIHARLTC